MPSLETKYFGVIPYDFEAGLDFPGGLPGFEQCRAFLALRFPDTQPLVFLQSMEDPGLCFITLPVLSIDPGYRLYVSDEDRERIGLARGQPLRIGTDVLCLAVIALRESGPTANLLAPVVINLGNRKAVQAVAADSAYSHQHQLMVQEAPVCS